MSGIPPIPTFVPQDAWYELTVGNYNPSEANSVPSAALLSPQGGQDGLVGSLDGGLIYLAGSQSELDGGQQWLMWVAASLAVADEVTVFNPWVQAGVPGRWVATTAAPAAMGPGGQLVTAGGAAAVMPSTFSPVNVVVQLAAPAAVTIYLPSAPKQWQEFRIIDGWGIVDPDYITVNGNGNNINGVPSLVITTQGGVLKMVWSGTRFNLL
jgi:hypothetical protein